MEYGILRIFPALLHEPFSGALLILHEAGSIAIAVRVDPFQSALDVWPDLIHQRQIPGALEVGPRKHHEEWGGIDAAVIAPEGDFFRYRHFTAAHLVQDFSGFRVLLGYFLRGLRFGQIFQDAFRHPRRGPEAFERGDDAVAAEHGAEPGHSGIRIRAFRIVFDEHPKVRRRAVEPRVETFAGSCDVALFAASVFRVAYQGPERGVIGNDAVRVCVTLAGNRGVDRGFLFGFQRNAKQSFARRKRRRLRRKLQARAAKHAVQPLVREYCGASVNVIGQPFALAGALGAAHLENVGEVRIELE